MDGNNQHFKPEFSAGSYDQQGGNTPAEDLQAQYTRICEQNRKLVHLLEDNKIKFAEVAEKLRQSESVRNTEVVRLGDMVQRAEKLSFDLQQNAREEAERIIAEANTKAAGITIAAEHKKEKIRKQFDDELAAMLQIGQAISTATAAARQSMMSMFGEMDGKSRDLETFIFEQRTNYVPSAAYDSDVNFNYSSIDGISNTIPRQARHPYDSNDLGHKIFGGNQY